MTSNMTAETKQIRALRDSIDRIDDRIVQLINQRLDFAVSIGKIKTLGNLPIADPKRESALYSRLKTINEGPLNDTGLHYIFSEIIAAARELQSPRRVCYLGPEATFTHIAALNHFGRTAKLFSQPSIRDVFTQVEKGAFHYGVVPVENSIEGAVNHTLDLFFESDLKICAEVYLSISHDLLTHSDSLEKIEIVYSHPHAFAQCRQWLRKNLPNAALEECRSTANAAQKASHNPNTAAIAGSKAAHLYNLFPIVSGIEDVARNTTRFLIIGRDTPAPTTDDKTSLMFVTAHVPGALNLALAPIAESGINMVKLESRPVKYENWSYFFIVDLEGHKDDPNMQKAVQKMTSRCLYLKWLGSYSRATGK
ncbi:MAG: prephenate dehydratase [Deltaproteobacteria bacterium]|nr:prephenate dehydratase [Deltaproteobacteria bacterium]